MNRAAKAAISGAQHATWAKIDARRDPVTAADHDTSLCDWRAAHSIAVGVPLERIDPTNGRWGA